MKTTRSCKETRPIVSGQSKPAAIRGRRLDPKNAFAKIDGSHLGFVEINDLTDRRIDCLVEGFFGGKDKGRDKVRVSQRQEIVLPPDRTCISL